MPSSIAIDIRRVSQVYRLYTSAASMAFDALGFNRLLFWKKKQFRTFEALSDVSVQIRQGERIGLIGRNGAGKTTLLKLITQNYEATSGEVIVNGRIQSLMDQGVGFHPEFTGRQNIRSSLIYNGILGQDVEAYEKDILDFVELDEFIDQPIKTYSLGMKARLGFATATAVKPNILIVDEVLGAGDAYFSSKSAIRMKRLTAEGVTLLLVSHSKEQILQFCERAIWMERGKIVADGPALEVVKAYDKFIRNMENEKLNLQNADEADESAVRSGQLLQQQVEVSKWKGSGELTIDKVQILDGQGAHCAIFKTGKQLQVALRVRAKVGGSFPVRANVYIYSTDGRPICQFTSDELVFNAKLGDTVDFNLKIDRLLIGNGEFVFSPAIYSALDYGDLASSKYYEIVDRSFTFRVYSDFEGDHSTFVQPGEWVVVRADATSDEVLLEGEASILGRSSLGRSYRD